MQKPKHDMKCMQLEWMRYESDSLADYAHSVPAFIAMDSAREALEVVRKGQTHSRKMTIKGAVSDGDIIKKERQLERVEKYQVGGGL